MRSRAIRTAPGPKQKDLPAGGAEVPECADCTPSRFFKARGLSTRRPKVRAARFPGHLVALAPRCRTVSGLVVGLILVVATVPRTLWANALDNYGFGSHWISMGGAVTALVDDVASIYYNPAGLVRADDVEVMVEYFYSDPSLIINDHDIGEDTASGIVAGFALPPMKIGAIKMGGGGAIHLPDKRVARSLAIPYDQPTFVQYGSRIQRMVIMTPFSFEIFPWLTVGASVSMFMRTSGGPDFLLREDRPDNQGLWSEGSISTSQRPSFWPTAGIQVRPTDKLRLGFCYRGKNEILYKVPLKVHIEPLHIFPENPVPLLGESLIDMDQHVFTFFAPEQFSLGLGYEFSGDLTVGLDVTLLRWSAFRQPSPEGATYFLGGIASLVPPNPNYPLPPPNFSDVVSPAIGVDCKVLSFPFWELFVRAGYRFRPSPAPEATGWNNFLDNDTHIFSGGVGIRFLRTNEKLKVIRGPISIDVHGQYFWLVEDRALKENPVADAYGDMVFRGRVIAGGVTLTLEF